MLVYFAVVFVVLLLLHVLHFLKTLIKLNCIRHRMIYIKCQCAIKPSKQTNIFSSEYAEMCTCFRKCVLYGVLTLLHITLYVAEIVLLMMCRCILC